MPAFYRVRCNGSDPSANEYIDNRREIQDVIKRHIVFRFQCDYCDTTTSEYTGRGGAIEESLLRGWAVWRTSDLTVHCVCERCRKQGKAKLQDGCEYI